MPVTKAKIEQLARALFPRSGIKDVASLVATIVKYRDRDGHVKIWRSEGGWSWHASPGATVVTPSLVTLWFPADHRRDAAQARDDLYRQLEDASLSVMSEDEIEVATGAARRRRGRETPRVPSATPISPPPAEPPRVSTAQIKHEVAKILSTPPPSNLGMARAERLAEGLRALGHEAEAFRQYGMWNSVGVHRVGRGTAGEWRQIVTFFDDAACTKIHRRSRDESQKPCKAPCRGACDPDSSPCPVAASRA